MLLEAISLLLFSHFAKLENCQACPILVLVAPNFPHLLFVIKYLHKHTFLNELKINLNSIYSYANDISV